MAFPQSLSLAGDLTRDRAVAELLAPSPVEDPDNELLLNASGVDSVDVVTAVAARMRIARHLREHPAGHATIWLPTRSGVAARLADVLRPFPDRTRVAGVPDAAPPAHYTLVPATQVSDSDGARAVGEYAYDACHEARISRRRAAFVVEAVVELADNAIRHASAAPDPPVVAVTNVGRERIVQVAVVDSGTSVSEAGDPASLLRAIPGRAIAGEPGFLGQIVRKGRSAGVDARVRILAGTARLAWTPMSHRTTKARHVNGMTVIARIGA